MIENIPEIPTNKINFTPVVPAEKKVQPLTVIIIVIFVLLIGAGGFFLSKVFNKPKACTLEAKICPDGSTVGRIGPNCDFAPCPTQVISPTQTPDETANWKTYRNEEYEFEFKYPENWTTGPHLISSPYEHGIVQLNNDKQKIGAEPATIVILYWDNKEGLSLEKLEQKYTGQSGIGPQIYSPETEKIMIGGESAYFLKDGICEPVLCNKVTISLEGKVLQIINFDPSNQAIFDQILATFKFLGRDNVTESKITPTSILKRISILPTDGWKTVFLNGVSFKIPPEAECESAVVGKMVDDRNCSTIFFRKDQIPQTVEVTEYKGGSRREQYFGDGYIDCRWIFEEAIFGDIKALQIALDGGWCQGGGGAIVTVVGDRFVTFPNLGYNPETKVIDRFPIRDTVVSTLRVAQ